MDRGKRGLLLSVVLLLLLGTCITAMGQEKSAPNRGFETAILHETAAAESTEAPAESGGITMWDLTLIGLGIAVALLVIMLIMALTSHKETDKK